MVPWNERIEEYDTRDENVMCELFVSCRVAQLGGQIEHVALCMHDKEGGNPKTSLEIEGTKEKALAFMLL